MISIEKLSIKINPYRVPSQNIYSTENSCQALSREGKTLSLPIQVASRCYREVDISVLTMRLILSLRMHLSMPRVTVRVGVDALMHQYANMHHSIHVQ